MDNGITLTSLSEKPEKDSLSDGMTPRLEASVVLAKDLKQQPESSHILLVGAGHPNYYAVDSYELIDDTIIFRLHGQVIYACRVKEGTWAMVAREAVNVVTEKALTLKQHADSKLAETFYSDLDPEAWAEAQEYAKRAGGRGGMTLADLMGGQQAQAAPKQDDRPMPGHYL